MAECCPARVRCQKDMDVRLQFSDVRLQGFTSGDWLLRTSTEKPADEVAISV